MLKNAIDWLSRPALASVLRWKPVAIMGASSGRGGTKHAQQQVRDALLFPGAVVLEEPEVRLPVAWERFDPDLKLTDENAARDELLTGLLARPRRAGASEPNAVAARAARRGDRERVGRVGRVAKAHGIEAEGLVRTFKGDIRAVDGIDLRVEPGEIYGFLGPNGAGKSTTVHMLTTLLPPTAGTARVAGFDIVKDGPKVRPRSAPRSRRPRSTTCSPAASTSGSSAPCTGSRRPERKVARAGAARAGRPDAGGRPQGRRLLGRDEAPARPGAGARPPSVDPVPRRADDRPRPAEPERALERGRAARARGRA